ncbi:MAG TPA: hypothetical protein VGH20_01740 [Myxococcales bacterium]|jgi:hypothetical protein
MNTLLAVALVVCAPGYPGSTQEAQPAMDALARELSQGSHLTVTASYDETAQGGLRSVKRPDAGLVLATLPFFLEHERDLHLTAKLLAVPQDGQPLQTWTLVAGKDHPAQLDGYAVQSLAGDAPRFVRAVAPLVPKDAHIAASSSVLSGLRKAANGEKLAVLLDGAQAASLKTLPFAQSLATVSTSAPVPVAVVATVGKKIPAAQWKALEAAFKAVPKESLAGIQMSGFAPLDEAALSKAREAYRKAQ